MRSCRGVNELPGDTNSVPRPTHTAFENIANPEFTSDLLHVYSPALVGEARIASDDKQPPHSRECGDDLLYHSISEVLLVTVATEIFEWQDSDRWSIGKWQDVSSTNYGGGATRI